MNMFASLAEPMLDRPCVVSIKPVLKVVRIKRPQAPQTPWGLTASQCKVMPLITAGLTAKEIGQAMGLSERTIENHMRQLRVRMNARSNVVAAVMWDRWKRSEV